MSRGVRQSESCKNRALSALAPLSVMLIEQCDVGQLVNMASVFSNQACTSLLLLITVQYPHGL